MGANGQAVLTLTNIGPGVHSITASYGGDPAFLPSGSNAVSVKIDELRILRVGNNNTTILPGTTVVYTLQVQPQVATAFLYNVSFSASGLPAGATATFSPGTLPAGGPMANITMTVKTAATALNEPPPSPFDACRSPWGSCFHSWERKRYDGGCDRFRRRWVRPCLQRSPWPRLRA